MEPLQLLAGTALSLILSEASKEGGKSLGKAASGLVENLRKTIWKRLIQKDKWPDEMEQEELEGEIVEVFKQDESIAAQATSVIETVKSKDEIAKQVIIEHAKARNIKLGNVTQTAKSAAAIADQAVIRDAQVEGDIVISDINQGIL